MKKLYALGGRQKAEAPGLPEWHQYGAAVVSEVDVETGSVEVVAEHRSPAEVCPDEAPSILFKAGWLTDGELFVCTQTELLVYSVPDFEVRDYVSLPLFNDLHHVRPTPDGTLLVANTGLDMVVEVTRAGDVVGEWGVLGQDPWERFSREVDYRKVATTKPHASHPNYVFLLGDEKWVTRFEQKDAVSLRDAGRRIAIDLERPHDGLVHEGLVYFTTVDGWVVVADAETLEVKRRVDLGGAHRRSGRLLGWCRGLHVVDRNRVVVGFSRLRPTKWTANVSWVKHSIGSLKASLNLPTRLALYDLATEEIVWEHSLEKPGMNVVFSMHDRESPN